MLRNARSLFSVLSVFYSKCFPPRSWFFPCAALPEQAQYFFVCFSCRRRVKYQVYPVGSNIMPLCVWVCLQLDVECNWYSVVWVRLSCDGRKTFIIFVNWKSLFAKLVDDIFFRSLTVVDWWVGVRSCSIQHTLFYMMGMGWLLFCSLPMHLSISTVCSCSIQAEVWQDNAVCSCDSL